MKSKLLSIFALSIALITSELQAQTVIFSNLEEGANVISFGGGTGFSQSRTVVGDDFDTIPTPNPDGSWLVNSIDFTAILFPETAGEQTTFNDIEVEVSLVDLGNFSVIDASGNPVYTAAGFSTADVLGSEAVTLGFTGNFNVFGTTRFEDTVTFTNPINIGDGIGTGIFFRLSDSTGGTELGLLSIGYRNNGSPEPSVGVTSTRNYRDEANNGSISGAFSFNNDFGLSYRINATAVDDDEILLGDANLDGFVNFLDISPFISILSGGTGFLAEADINQDGTVNFLDIAPFIGILFE